MGSLIMPHNIYLHSALVQSRKLMANTPGHKKEALMYFGIESALSLLVRACWWSMLGCGQVWVRGLQLTSLGVLYLNCPPHSGSWI